MHALFGAPIDRAALLERVCAHLFDAPTAAVRLARYELRERVGAGATSVVWRAWDPELGRDVAVKLAHREPGTMAYLRHEARVLASLNHAAIVGVFDVGGWDEGDTTGIYIVQEFLAGGNLAQWLAAAPRTTEQIVDLFCVAALALHAAHRAGVLHRDFKPSNVLLSDRGAAKLGDFGLARVVSAPRSSHSHRVAAAGMRISSTGDTIGTPLYMAPEQHEGRGVDARSDQFALCAALFEALCGHPPFHGASDSELAQAKRNGAIDAIDRKRGSLARIGRVLERGLDPEPAARWSDMAALVAALRAAVRPSGRGWFGIAAAASVVLALAWSPGRTTNDRPCETGPALDETWQRWRGDGIARLALRWQDRADIAGQFAARGDRLVERWSDARARVCGSTEPLARAAGASCLGRTRAELGALLGIVGTDALVEPRIALAGMATIADPLLCLDDRGAGSQPRAESEQRELLVQADVLERMADIDASLELRERAITRAAAEGDRFTLLEALLDRATARARFGAAFSEDDLAELQRVYFLAGSMDEHQLATRAATRVAFHYSDGLSDIDRAREWLRHASASLRRAGTPRSQEVDVLDVQATVEKTAGDFELAEQLRRQLRERCGDEGCSPRFMSRALANECTMYHERGDFARALPVCREAVAHDHQYLIDLDENHETVLLGLAGVEIMTRHPDEAAEIADEVLVRIAGRDDRTARARRAVALQIKARVLGLRGEWQQSVGLLAEAVEIADATLPDRRGSQTFWLVANLGLAELKSGDYPAAAERFARLAEGETARQSPDPRKLALARRFEGIASLDAGDARRAVKRLEAALALVESSALDAQADATTRFHLARALVASGGDRRRAMELARAAYATVARRTEAPDHDFSAPEAIASWLRAMGEQP